MRALTNNWPLKLLAFAIALGLSIYVYQYGEYETQTTLDLPLEVRNLSEDLTFLQQPPASVKVNVAGNLQQISEIKRQNARAIIDLKGFTTPGTFTITPDMPDLPPLKIYGSVPIVRMRLANRQRIRLPVEVWHRGQLPQGYLLSKENLQPGEAYVEGPEDIVSTAKRVIAEVDLTGRMNRISQAIPLVAYTRDNSALDPGVVRVEPASGQYSADVNPVSNVKAVMVNAVITGNPPAGYFLKEMRLTPSQVLFPDSLFKLHPLKTVNTEPISLEGITGSFTQKVIIEYGFKPPSDIPLEADVEIILGKLETGSENMLSVSIELRGRSDGYEYTLRPQAIIVQSSGLAQYSDTERKRIKAYVDVTGLVPGTYSVLPQIMLPAGLHDVTSAPQMVEVSVTKR
jgi:YbbR domain-containing protein